MRTTILAFLLFLLGVCSIGLMGATDGDKLVIQVPYETLGQKHWFATTSGTGDCTSWNQPCTFRTALGKCTSTVMDVIWLGPGAHETDNLSDANGTDVSVDYVLIEGTGMPHSFPAMLRNSDAGAAYVLRISGDRVSLNNIMLTQEGMTDEDVTYVDVSGDYSTIDIINIQSSAGAASDIGIEYNSGSGYHFLQHAHIDNFHTAAIKTNDAHHVEMKVLAFHGDAVAIHLSHADDTGIEVFEAEFDDCALAIHVDAGVDETHFYRPTFVNCTNNVDDDGDFDEIHYVDVELSHLTTATYPVNAGVAVATNVAAWTQGNLVQIVPASAITEPFIITGINVQSATAANTFKVEVFWDSAAGTTHTIGIFEFTEGAAFQGVTTFPSLNIGRNSIPANAYVGAKSACTDGTCTTTITISIQEI